MQTRYWPLSCRQRKMTAMNPKITPAPRLEPRLTFMQSKAFAFTLFYVAAFAVGCNHEPSASQQLDKIKIETTAAAQDMNNYTYDQKAEFTAKMQSQLT